MRTKSELSPTAQERGSVWRTRNRDEVDFVVGDQRVPRDQLVAEAAYFRAEQRGFAPGNELSDWFEAEADVERRLRGETNGVDLS